jgi:S1-C subfamily serine protease
LGALLEVVAFGFPFGRGPDAGGDQYISNSDTRGPIRTLKRKGGRLNRIQLNAAVNPGNSGGSPLNSKGGAVGVIVGRVEGNVGLGIDGLARSYEHEATSLYTTFCAESRSAI